MKTKTKICKGCGQKFKVKVPFDKIKFYCKDKCKRK